MITQPYIVLPDGTRIYVGRITMLQVLTSKPTTLTIGFGDVLSTYSYTAIDAGSAGRMLAQIDAIIQGQMTTGTILDYATPAITTVVADLGTALSNNTLTITGLTLQNSSYMMLSGITTQYQLASVSSTQVVTFANVNVPAGTYDVSLYDAGNTFIALLSNGVTFT